MLPCLACQLSLPPLASLTRQLGKWVTLLTAVKFQKNMVGQARAFVALGNNTCLPAVRSEPATGSSAPALRQGTGRWALCLVFLVPRSRKRSGFSLPRECEADGQRDSPRDRAVMAVFPALAVGEEGEVEGSL